MASAKQRRPATEPVTFSFLVSWPVATRVTVTVEPDGRIVRLTCAASGCAPTVNSTVSLDPITYGIVTAIVAVIAKTHARSARTQPAMP